MKIVWPHGLEDGPDGPCREIPQRFTWSSSCWCTEDGTMWPVPPPTHVKKTPALCGHLGNKLIIIVAATFRAPPAAP